MKEGYYMKRTIAVIIAAAVISTSSALADSVSQFVEQHNRNGLASGSSEITGEPLVEENHYQYHVTENVDVLISTDGNDVQSFSCICFDESGVGEFLAQCVTAFYDIGGLDAYVYCHDPLLSDFLSARAGHETESDSTIPGVLFQVKTAENPFRYIFIIVKVK